MVFIYVYLPICRSTIYLTHPSTYSSIHPSIYIPIHSFIHVPIHPSIHLSIHSPMYTSTHLPIYPPSYPFFHTSIHLLLHPPTQLFIHLLNHSFIHSSIYLFIHLPIDSSPHSSVHSSIHPLSFDFCSALLSLPSHFNLSPYTNSLPYTQHPITPISLHPLFAAPTHLLHYCSHYSLFLCHPPIYSFFTHTGFHFHFFSGHSFVHINVSVFHRSTHLSTINLFIHLSIHLPIIYPYIH